MKIFRNDMIKFVLKNTLNYNKIFGLQSEFFFNPPGTTGYGQHQDDFFLKTGKNNSANLWIPLIKTSKIILLVGIIAFDHLALDGWVFPFSSNVVFVSESFVEDLLVKNFL